ncbi:GNAT family N-acetyltransferase [Phaeobacter inhibens]|uniref:GNAT family N-acetyltransferase n=1 Tax=Phaeobacter inhibens TaxID=221822 RepID=UPI0021A6EFA4|nr:GNAT family N-acetyltransferase [Phaeobacter inhibens]UWR78977.1 GNAT family N-acetyltransferase [Phaeobacter inhibens]
MSLPNTSVVETMTCSGVPHVDSDAYLSAVYGKTWERYAYSDGDGAFRHACVTQRLKGTGYAFAESWRGYFDPVLSRQDPHLLVRALEDYSAWCRSRGIVCEFMRCDPTGKVAELIASTGFCTVEWGQYVAMLDCPSSMDTYLSSLRKKHRYTIKSARDQYEVERVTGACRDQVAAVHEVLFHSLQTLGTLQRWYLSQENITTLANLSFFDIYLVRSNGAPVGACAAMTSDATTHLLFLGVKEKVQNPGVSDLMYFKTIEGALAKNKDKTLVRQICFGGGRGTSDGDGLIRFKKKFALGRLVRCPYLVLAHDTDAVAALSRAAGQTRPFADIDPSSQLKLKHFPFLLCQI